VPIRPVPARRCRGFTLVELVAGLAIVTGLLGLGVPTFARFLEEQRLLGDARRLSETILLARSEAIKRNGVVILCAVAPPDGCGDADRWHEGWMAFEDLDGNGTPDDGDRLVPAAEPAGRPGVTIVGNAPVERYLRFTYAGSARLVSGALQMGTFTVCKPGLRGYRVVLAHSGRTRIERLAAPCP
jgi:type IV fimbrial biogenesis protein FimT